jgi:hypothetical protein
VGQCGAARTVRALWAGWRQEEGGRGGAAGPTASACSSAACTHHMICVEILLLPLLLLPGSDHRLAAWDATTFAEVWRTKLDAKSPATSLAYSHRCSTLACLLLVCPTAASVGCCLY